MNYDKLFLITMIKNINILDIIEISNLWNLINVFNFIFYENVFPMIFQSLINKKKSRCDVPSGTTQ